MPYNFVPYEKGVKIEGLNIAVGLEPPEDTSKLWVKTDYIEGFEIVQVDAVHLLDGKLSSTGMGCAAVGTKIYTFGGMGTAIKRFDTETGEVVTLSEALPKSLGYMACAAVGSKIYLLNGCSTSAVGTIYCFDADTEKVEVIRSSGTGKMFGSAAAVGTKIYHAGYSTNTSETLKDGYYDMVIREFDTETNQETSTGVRLPYSYVNRGCVSIGKYVYWIGGRSRNSDTNSIVRFDTETKEVMTVSNGGFTDLAWMGCAVVNEKIYILGGCTVSGSASVSNQKAIKCYDPQLKVCTTMTYTLGTAKRGMGCVAVGNSVYVLGGNTATSPTAETYNSQMERVDVIPELSHKVLQLQINLDSEKFEVLKGNGVTAEYSFKDAVIGTASGIGKPVEIAVYKDGEWQTKV